LATAALTTSLYFNTTDGNGGAASTWLTNLGTSTNSIKGSLRIFVTTNPATYADYQITSSTNNSTYFTVAVTYVGSNGTFSASNPLGVSFARAGNVGPAPAGNTGAVLYLQSTGVATATATTGLVWDNTNTRLGIGLSTSAPAFPLSVSGTAQSNAAPYSNLAFQTGGWVQAYEATNAVSIKIYTDGKIGCTEVDVFSDRRIKKDIQDSETVKNLEIIRGLSVRDFKYKDPIEHGPTRYTGLIAQEVKDIFPSAVSVHEGVIPDIFQIAKSFSQRTCYFESKIEGLLPGSMVKIIDENLERKLKVLRVSAFEIEFDDDIQGPRVFVYGQVVKDFHTVSYDRLVPVLISAVQCLLEKVESTCPTPSDTHT
jgi:hypothetical protein